MQLIRAQERHILDLVKISEEAFESDCMVGATHRGGPPEYNSVAWHLTMMKEGHLFTAIEEENMVGGAIIFLDENNSSFMYVGRIFVNPLFFRKGYGAKIMEELENMDLNISTWKLDTPIWNQRTNQFYKKLGYVETYRDNQLVYYEKHVLEGRKNQ